MKNNNELREIFQRYSWSEMNVHVHTHLCDGKPEMTVENIAAKAKEVGVRLVVLVPHFHRQLEENGFTLYEDSDEMIFMKLREEIEAYKQRDAEVQFLLSTETDILNVNGDISLPLSTYVEKYLDFIMPTLNFHPLLPLRAVRVTEPVGREKLHSSGEYASMVEQSGGMERIVEAIYTAQANAIKKSPYPAMLGHFFSAHSYNGPYSWFGLEEKHLPIMMAGAEKILEVCKNTGTTIDITGNRMKDTNIEAKKQSMGFLLDFQKWFLNRCNELGIITCPGGDAHDLNLISGTWFYKDLLSR